MNTREQVEAFNRDLAEVFARHGKHIGWSPDFLTVVNTQGEVLADINIEREGETVRVTTLEMWK